MNKRNISSINDPNSNERDLQGSSAPDPRTGQTLRYMSIFLLGFFMIALTGCDSSTDGDLDDNGNDEPAANEVWMVGMSFSPGERVVDVGTRVTWINQSNLVHTVTSGVDGDHDGEFDSGNMGPDATFSHTFNEPGSYYYYCVPHLQDDMTGVIHVVNDNDDNGDDNGY